MEVLNIHYAKTHFSKLLLRVHSGEEIIIAKAGKPSLDITPEHAQLSGAWDISHRDPFDRMLAAQSKLENLPLASTDKAMTLFPITVNRE